MKASVALTTYNGMGNIKELLDSIKNQKELPDEVIIVDDASTDGTGDIIDEYAKKYESKTGNYNYFIEHKK